MKVRSGFVSNSSSSSFIVTLPQDITKYSLEEFRELVGGGFDPVEKLYNDLLNKAESQPYFEKYERERYGIDHLEYNQYLVKYGNECVDYGDKFGYEEQDFMENSFMEELEDNSDGEIIVQKFGNH